MRGQLLVIGALACLTAAGFAGRDVAGAPAGDGPSVASAGLSGHWQLNPRLSEDAREAIRQAAVRRRASEYERNGEAPPPPAVAISDVPDDETVHALLEPAERLTIEQNGSRIVMDEEFARRRTLLADGRKHKAGNGLAEVTSEWREGRLVVQTREPRGRKTTETWELAAGGKRLTATFRIDSDAIGRVTFNRVYDRIAGEDAAAPPPQD